MDSYIAHNYSKCSPENFTYFSTPEYMEIVVRIISIISTPIWCLGFYLVLKATPKNLENVKIVMLHTHVFTFLLDFVIFFLVTPTLFLPACAGYLNGMLPKIGVPFKISMLLGQMSITCVGYSYVMLFENRHHSLAMINFKLSKPINRYIFFSILYTCSFLAVVSSYFEVIDQNSAKLEILKTIPCPLPLFFEPGAQVLATDVHQISLICLINAGIMSLIGCFFFLHTSYHLTFTVDRNMSKITRDLQRRFLRNLCIQVTIPTSVIITPSVLCFLQMMFGEYNQAVNNHIVIGLSAHSLAANLALCLIHKPYRNAAIQMFSPERKKKSGLAIIRLKKYSGAIYRE